MAKRHPLKGNKHGKGNVGKKYNVPTSDVRSTCVDEGVERAELARLSTACWTPAMEGMKSAADPSFRLPDAPDYHDRTREFLVETREQAINMGLGFEDADGEDVEFEFSHSRRLAG